MPDLFFDQRLRLFNFADADRRSNMLALAFISAAVASGTALTKPAENPFRRLSESNPMLDACGAASPSASGAAAAARRRRSARRYGAPPARRAPLCAQKRESGARAPATLEQASCSRSVAAEARYLGLERVNQSRGLALPLSRAAW